MCRLMDGVKESQEKFRYCLLGVSQTKFLAVYMLLGAACHIIFLRSRFCWSLYGLRSSLPQTET